jgi:(p)ppGpp synthase/HD superfamily hydrolase
MDRINKAIIYAAKHHQQDFRKGTIIPCIVHPFSVMYSLKDSGFDGENLLIATLLHDIIEDTSEEIENIESEFGPYVAELAESVSEDK